LILGCTHYPLIKKQINQYYDGKVTVLDTSEIVAKSLYDYLENNHLLNDMNAHIRHFYVSDYTQSFETSTKIFLVNKFDFNTIRFGNSIRQNSNNKKTCLFRDRFFYYLNACFNFLRIMSLGLKP
jgi:hypothetical protein